MAAAAPVLRAVWLIGVPVLAVLWAARVDRRLMTAALFAGAAAAFAPVAIFDIGMSMALGVDPSGAQGAGLFTAGVLALIVVALGAGGAAILRYMRRHGRPMPTLPVVVLFLIYYVTAIAPFHSRTSDAFAPGLGGPGDPLAILAPLHAVEAPAMAFAAVAFIALALLSWRRA
ncbi:hypothetical protein ATO6_09550 [Oceanicola sp. 22II-s10i]|nr:hypothetical protein ATO6_09550 [Oceanicola sp. 22II-s10i]